MKLKIMAHVHVCPVRFLVAFLQEFSLYVDLTKMSTNNIAIVIGPNLLWPMQRKRMLTQRK